MIWAYSKKKTITPKKVTLQQSDNSLVLALKERCVGRGLRRGEAKGPRLVERGALQRPQAASVAGSSNQNEQPGAKTKTSRQGQNKTSSQGQIKTSSQGQKLK